MVFISYRIDFVSDKKSLGAGKKRTITFNQGDSEQEQIEAKGMLKGDLSVAVSKGLPNTSSKNCQSRFYLIYFKQRSINFNNYPNYSFVEPKKDTGGNAKRPRPQQTQKRQSPNQGQPQRSNHNPPRAGPGAPLPAIPIGKCLYSLYLYAIFKIPMRNCI